ncbi:MAG: hypothetical protein H7Z74_06495 [Anaerolineae bacterium]|nr:hypothetical protein [Gemmatimonadaceae bacterium]
MKGKFAALGGRAACAVLIAMLIAACDDDPTSPPIDDLVGDLALVPDTLGVQEAIRIVFNRSIDPASAVDPANVVVTNLCDTLRVPGSLRVGRDLVNGRDTIIFSPAQSVPFLTLLGVRVQNILDSEGRALEQPITFQRITQLPPVSDLTWEFLNSPTNESVTGISFVDDNVGYSLGLNGTVYRTNNGGDLFAAIFKAIDITDAFAIRAISADTAFMVAAINVLGVRRWALFRSVNGGLAFDTIRTVSSQVNTLSLRRGLGTGGAPGRPVALFGGNGPTAIYRYDGATGTVTTSTAPIGGLILIGVDLSTDTIHALSALTNFGVTPAAGVAVRSTDGGRSFTSIALPANIPTLRGAGFITAREGFLLGDSSTVLRVNAATGVVQVLGAAQGIPQTLRDSVTRSVTSFQFSRSSFTADGVNGYIVGTVRTSRPGAPDALRGVILQTQNGGLNFTRQAIQGATDNGLNFPPVFDVQTRSALFAALAGGNGLVAARVGNPPSVAAACSFNNQG